VVAERLAPMHVGQVDSRRTGSPPRQRVADRDAGVREGGRIDDDERHACVARRAWIWSTSAPFVVALESDSTRTPAAAPIVASIAIDLRQRGGP
jgi:hypothetical protein